MSQINFKNTSAENLINPGSGRTGIAVNSTGQAGQINASGGFTPFVTQSGTSAPVPIIAVLGVAPDSELPDVSTTEAGEIFVGTLEFAVYTSLGPSSGWLIGSLSEGQFVTHEEALYQYDGTQLILWVGYNKRGKFEADGTGNEDIIFDGVLMPDLDYFITSFNGISTGGYPMFPRIISINQNGLTINTDGIAGTIYYECKY